MTTRNQMIAKLHVLKRDNRLDDDAYRAKLELATGHRSAADCTDAELEKALSAFHVKQKRNNSYTGKAKALFISAYNLGGISDGSDAALNGFVKRQTGKDRLAFLTAAETNTVSEALKAICARHGFVAPASDRQGRLPREALLKAQWKLLHGLGAIRNPNEGALDEWASRKFCGCHGALINLTVPQLDQAIRALGFWIRKQKAATQQKAGEP